MLKHSLVWVLLVFICTGLTGQEYLTKKDVSGKVLKYYNEARSALNQHNNKMALESLDKALKKTPNFIDAQLMKADILLQIKHFAEAEKSFEKAILSAPDYASLTYLLLAEAEMNQEKYGEAVTHLEEFLAFEKISERRKARAQQLLTNAQFAAEAVKNPVPFDPVSLGETINTSRPEYLPSLTANGELLVYTSRVDGRHEDIFFSEYSDSAWGKGQPLAALNTPGNDSSPSIAANGRSMAFARDNRETSFDLYFAEQKAERWIKPERLPSPISTKAWESQPCLSADGRELFFVSDRQGGKGQLDIWVCTRQPDGQWGAPVNLGKPINTALNEQAPFLHPDGQTLYFMSKGHPGMGAYDLYFSRRNEEGDWSTPQNLGYPVNTINNEGALIVSLDGSTAYFDTDKLGPTGKYQEMGNADLFSFELHEEARPLPVTYVQAKVRDADTRRPLEAQVSFVKLEHSRTFLEAMTDEKGQFLTVLPLGENYALNVSKPGYLFYSENFALEEMTSIQEPFILDIRLRKVPTETSQLQENKPIILKNIFFDTGSADLLPTSITELEKLQQLLEDHLNLHIQINGHTDNIGQAKDNLILSEARAKAVSNYLIEKGIEKERLLYKGFGEERPIATNNTAEGRQTNRRTEFEVIK